MNQTINNRRAASETLLVVSPTRTYISQLRRSGPIAQPIRITVADAINMLMCGVELHEYDLRTKTTVKLTLQNVESPNNFGKRPIAAMGTPIIPSTDNGVPTGREAKVQPTVAPVIVEESSNSVDTNIKGPGTQFTVIQEESVNETPKDAEAVTGENSERSTETKDSTTAGMTRQQRKEFYRQQKK